MDLGSRRQNVPFWPPPRRGAYQNLSSTDDLPGHDTPSLSTPGTGMSATYQNLLTPRISPSPGLDRQYTPYLNNQSGLRYDSEAPKKNWFGYGWRGGARIAFFSTVTILLINVVLMVYMNVAFQKMDGFPVIYRGKCAAVERQNSIWHLALNVLSTGLLSASNYAMQLLSSPTRPNIDRAHARGHWLDIGIPSIRNLLFLSWKRRTLWLVLCISSIPLHLVYNSTFYAALATNDYNVLYATEDFVRGGGYDKVKFPDSSAQNISAFQASATAWKQMDNRDCINNYAHDFISQYRNVILMVSNVTAHPNETLLQVVVNELPPSGHLDATFDSFHWICNDTQTSNKTNVWDRNSAGFVPCAAIAPKLENIANAWWKSGGYSISGCYAEETRPDCHLHFAPHFMGPVILMNIVKCLVIFYVAFRIVDVPLVTMGDAIESFIKHPDPTTAGMCLLTSHQAERTFTKSTAYTGPPAPQYFEAKRQHWRDVITKRQWALLIALVAVMLTGLILGIFFGTRSLAPPTLANAWSLGLGQVQTQNLILGANLPQLGASAVLVTALVANAPQALLSFLYMVYDTLFTLMFLGEDWDLFGAYTVRTRTQLQVSSKKQRHRYLRVSDPKGNQKSTHFLNLPFRYAIPLVCISGLLHWLMSQSLFLANISVIPRDGTVPRHDEITTVAFAPQGMIWLCVLAVVMLAALTLNGLRKFSGQMQIVGSNSAAISAACHAEQMPEVRRREMVLRKIAWGEIPSAHDAQGLGSKSTMMSSQESELSMGLGIDSGERGKFYAQDFEDVKNRDGNVEQNDYQALRGHIEMIDSRGQGRGTAVAHCTFSDGFLAQPTVGRLYA